MLVTDLLPPTVTRTAFRVLNSVVRPALAAGLGNPLPFGVGAAVVETTGRTSGQPRRVPVLTARFGDRLAVSTLRSDSHWFANLEADPDVRVQLFGDDRPAVASSYRGPLNVAILDLAD